MGHVPRNPSELQRPVSSCGRGSWRRSWQHGAEAGAENPLWLSIQVLCVLRTQLVCETAQPGELAAELAAREKAAVEAKTGNKRRASWDIASMAPKQKVAEALVFVHKC